MKRSRLLSSAAIVALLVGCVSSSAQADLPTIDITSITQRAAQAAKELGQLIQEYQLMQQEYSEMIATFNALSHPNEALAVATGLLQQQIQSPGSLPSTIPGLAFGAQLSGYGQQFYAQNHFYSGQGDDFEAMEMARREQGIDNLQGEAQAGMSSAQERIEYLQEQRASVEDDPDITAVSATESTIASENAYLQNESNNVARIQLMEQTQVQVDEQRSEQNARKEDEDWHAQAAAAAGLDTGGDTGPGSVDANMLPADQAARQAALQQFLNDGSGQ